MDDSIIYKILVVGDSGVGKTSLLSRVCSKKCTYGSGPTIGCDFGVKVLKNFSGHEIRLQLWEVAGKIFFSISIIGHDKYTSLSKLYLRGASGIIILTDITKSSFLDSAFEWLEKFKENEDSMKQDNLPVILFQNKVDLIEQEDELMDLKYINNVREIAKQKGFLDCFQVSTKSKYNLEEGIEFLVREILKLEKEEDKFSETRVGDTIVNLDPSPKRLKSIKQQQSPKGNQLISSNQNKIPSRKPSCACLC